MSDRGYGFHQTTISRIEAGERPLRLDEALDLADILVTSVERLADAPERVVAQELVEHADDKVSGLSRKLEDTAAELIGELRYLQEAVDFAKSLGVDTSRAEELWLPQTPEFVVERARGRFDEDPGADSPDSAVGRKDHVLHEVAAARLGDYLRHSNMVQLDPAEADELLSTEQGRAAVLELLVAGTDLHGSTLGRSFSLARKAQKKKGD